MERNDLLDWIFRNTDAFYRISTSCICRAIRIDTVVRYFRLLENMEKTSIKCSYIFSKTLSSYINMLISLFRISFIKIKLLISIPIFSRWYLSCDLKICCIYLQNDYDSTIIYIFIYSMISARCKQQT